MIRYFNRLKSQTLNNHGLYVLVATKTVAGEHMTTKDKSNNNGTEVESKKKSRKDNGKHHIGFEIPEELYQRAKQFNEDAERPIKFDKLFIKALTAALDDAQGVVKTTAVEENK